MFDLEAILKQVQNTLNDFVQQSQPQETVTDVQGGKKTIELPAPPPSGGFSGSPSGDTEYDEAMAKWHRQVNAIILDAIPLGFKLKSSEIKEEKIVRHFAEIVVEKS
jgi:hypothetical protein